MDCVPKVERCCQLGNVGGIGVHLVAGVGLGRAAVPATIMRDDAIAVLKEEHHLVVPVIGAERPTVVEDDWLSVLRSPVLVEDFHAVSGDKSCHVMPRFGE